MHFREVFCNKNCSSPNFETSETCFGSTEVCRLNSTIISTFVLGLLNSSDNIMNFVNYFFNFGRCFLYSVTYSTIHIPWRRKERGGELIIQLSTTPSVRDDGSSVWGRLNNTIISTFVLGLQEVLKIIYRKRGVGYFLYESHVLVGADPSGTTTVWAEEESTGSFLL